ncbi:MAG: WecB/TagA/CpsF family glycosyltransferase [Anaerolinea sp.]|nr:WecB/TagA/CpsF family glycosyltransferase [Anaerolinea sp.]
MSNRITPDRILAIKIADIGDLILTTPALRALRECYPEARLDLLTTPHAAPILRGTGLVDTIIPFQVRGFERLRDLLTPKTIRELWALRRDLRVQRFDTVITFHQLSTRFGALKQALIQASVGARVRVGLDNGRGWFYNRKVIDQGFGVHHQVEYWLKLTAQIGARTSNTHLEIGISEVDQAWALEKLPPGRPYAAIHAGSGGLNLARRWLPERYAQIAEHLHRHLGYQIVWVGGKDDNTEDSLAYLHVPSINLAGQTNLNQLGAVLARCALFVGGDSGVMHLASAVPGLAVYSLFGPTNAAAWGPWTPDDRARLIHGRALCSPCGYVHHSVGLRAGCPAQSCMKAITVETVQAAFAGKAPPSSVRTRDQAPKVHVLGVPLDGLTFSELVDQIGGWINDSDDPHPRMIATANPELVMIAQHDSLFFDILNRADRVTADGIGLLWAAKHLNCSLPERVTGSDGLPRICERAAQEGWRVYLLGAGPGVAEKAAAVLKDRNPGLIVAGTYAGSPSPDEEDAILERINQAQADILFLAYGSPAQEKWIARNLPRLQVRVVMGVGGAFDFTAGVTQRAPEWMRRAGIEWLHRLIRQPWRWRRMLRLPRFVWAVLRRGEKAPFAFRA